MNRTHSFKSTLTSTKLSNVPIIEITSPSPVSYESLERPILSNLLIQTVKNEKTVDHVMRHSPKYIELTNNQRIVSTRPIPRDINYFEKATTNNIDSAGSSKGRNKPRPIIAPTKALLSFCVHTKKVLKCQHVKNHTDVCGDMNFSVAAELSKTKTIERASNDWDDTGCVITELCPLLEEYFHQALRIEDERMEVTLSRVDQFLNLFYPQLTKLGVRTIKILDRLFSPVVEQHATGGNDNEVTVWIPFDSHEIQVLNPGAGYVIIPLDPVGKTLQVCDSTDVHIERRPIYEDDLESDERVHPQKDRWQFGRSCEGTYLSPLEVSQTIYDLTDKVLSSTELFYSPHVATLLPFTIADGRAQVSLLLKSADEMNEIKRDSHCIMNLVPLCLVSGRSKKSELKYLTGRPYLYDADSGSDFFWRLAFPGEETKIMTSINTADCGLRYKAFRIMESVVRNDEKLKGLTRYHLLTVLFHSFDSEVDHTAHWQCISLESAFNNIVSSLKSFLDAGRLPHFLEPNFDLLANMCKCELKRWSQRVEFLFGSPDRTLRILRRRLDASLRSSIS